MGRSHTGNPADEARLGHTNSIPGTNGWDGLPATPSAHQFHRLGTQSLSPCSRDALSPEALNIASYDTRERARMEGRGGAGLKTGLAQAIRDIRRARQQGLAVDGSAQFG